jgi:ABC-type lipoprotein release transport system permease subunit
MIWLLALRNIVRNKKNSLVILLLITVITFLFFVGNSLISRSEQSLKEAFADSLTGDVVIQKRGELTMNLFGANAPVIDEYFAIPVLPAYDVVMEILKAEPGVAEITSQVSGKAYLDVFGVREGVLIAGVEPESYFPLFPGIMLEEGRFLRSGEYGALITRERAERIAAVSGQKPVPGTPLLFTSGGEAGFKIREVPLTGIFSYKNPGQFMNEIIILDPQTARVLGSIQVASSESPVSGEAADLLDVPLDDLFSGAFLDDALSGTEEEGGWFSQAGGLVLGGHESREDQPLIGGDWNFIILRLGKGIRPAGIIDSLNRKLAPYGVLAVNWRIAAGNAAILMLLIQLLFNAGVFLVSVAGIIAAVNILLIAVFKRTREIGTLRAIGAQDSYIRFLILGENGIIACAAGGIGILGGYWFFKFLNALDLVISNSLLASLLGGAPVLRLGFFPATAGLSFILAVSLGLAASLYPVETAVRIDPIVAVRQG